MRKGRAHSGPCPTHPKAPGLAQDLQVLMKVRLNVFVLITTFFGFFLAAKGLGGDVDKLDLAAPHLDRNSGCGLWVSGF